MKRSIYIISDSCNAITVVVSEKSFLVHPFMEKERTKNCKSCVFVSMTFFVQRNIQLDVGLAVHFCTGGSGKLSLSPYKSTLMSDYMICNQT